MALSRATLAQEVSDRDIGARLYLSRRTVGSHLSRAYPRLGVHTRAELRAVLGDVDASAGSGDG